MNIRTTTDSSTVKAMREAEKLEAFVLATWPEASPFDRLSYVLAAAGRMIGADLYPHDPSYLITASFDVVARAAELQQKRRYFADATPGQA